MKVQMYGTKFRERLQQCVTNYETNVIPVITNHTGQDDGCNTVETTDSITTMTTQQQQQYDIDVQYYFELYQFQQELVLQQQQQQSSFVPQPQVVVDDSTVPTTTTDDNDGNTVCLRQLQLLHDEFTNCQSMLDDVVAQRTSSRKDSNRKVPFLFYKYRQYLYNRKQQQQHTMELSVSVSAKAAAAVAIPPLPSTNNTEQSIKIPLRTTSTTTSNPDDNQNAALVSSSSSTIENFTHRIITVNEDGFIHHRQQQPTTTSTNDCNDDDDDDEEEIQRPQRITNQMIVVRNVKNCSIRLLGTYKSIHFVNVNDTIIDICCPIMGAIHVTDCHVISFIPTVQAQQLRLHNSHHIDCYHPNIVAGIILEDCQHILFHVVPPPAAPVSMSTTTTPTTCVQTVTPTHTLTVHDFNWLHNGRPSPNYTIIPTTLLLNDLTKPLPPPSITIPSDDHDLVQVDDDDSVVAIPDQSSDNSNDEQGNDSDDDEI